jgi:tRNA/rRNA methyltransferase
LIGYEWVQAGEVHIPPVELRHGEARLADQAEVLAFLQRLEAELDDCGFLRVPHMRAAMVRNLRAIFSRTRLTLQEVRTLHGVLTELVTKRLAKPPA